MKKIEIKIRRDIQNVKEQIKLWKQDINCVEKINKLFGQKLKKLYIILNQMDRNTAEGIWLNIEVKGELNSLKADCKLELKEATRKNHIKQLKREIGCIKKINKLFGPKLKKLYIILNRIDYIVVDYIWQTVETKGELNSLIAEWKLGLKEAIKELQKLKKEVSR